MRVDRSKVKKGQVTTDNNTVPDHLKDMKFVDDLLPDEKEILEAYKKNYGDKTAEPAKADELQQEQSFQQTYTEESIELPDIKVKSPRGLLPDVVIEKIEQGAWMAVTDIPSSFLGYPESIDISYRPYTYSEIDDISGGKMNLIDRYQYMIQGIRVRNFDILDMYLIDILYILLLRKISSLGADQFVGHYFYEGKRYTQVYSLTKDIVFRSPDVPNLPVVCVIHDVEMHFKPLTLRRYLQLLSVNLEADARSLMAAICINLSFGEAKDLVDTATDADVVLLKYIDNLLDMGVEPIQITIKDDKLEGGYFHGRILLDDIDSLVAPFCEDPRVGGNSIRFGL